MSLIQADARSIPLRDGVVQCVVTSPPYFGLRDYGDERQIGLEASPAEYVQTMVEVFREVRRVLADDGTVWLNVGDSYAGSWGAQGRPQGPTGEMATRSVISARQIAAHPKIASRTGTIGADWNCKPKDLLLVPFEIAYALRSDGWFLRSCVIWNKPNPMPESIQDRPTTAHEYVFLLSKSKTYYYDAAAIREPYSESTLGQFDRAYTGQATKQYEGTGAQNPSDVKRRIVDKQRGHGRRHAGFNDRWDADVEEYGGKHAEADPQSAGRRMLKNMKAAREWVLHAAREVLMVNIRERVEQAAIGCHVPADENAWKHVGLAAAREALLIARQEIKTVGYRPPVFEVTREERQAFLQAIDWVSHTLDRLAGEIGSGHQSDGEAEGVCGQERLAQESSSLSPPAVAPGRVHQEDQGQAPPPVGERVERRRREADTRGGKMSTSSVCACGHPIREHEWLRKCRWCECLSPRIGSGNQVTPEHSVDRTGAQRQTDHSLTAPLAQTDEQGSRDVHCAYCGAWMGHHSLEIKGPARCWRCAQRPPAAQTDEQGGAQAASGYSPREAPAPPPQDAQEAEELVYHAYVTARELREKHPAACIELDRIIDGLKAARRFIFRSYSVSQASGVVRAEWQPIETAPKGTWGSIHDVRDPAYVAPPHLWLLLPDGQRCVGSADYYYSPEGNGYDGDSYWVEEFSGERVRPTRWMPLPDLPSVLPSRVGPQDAPRSQDEA